MDIFEQMLGDSEGQGSLALGSLWNRRVGYNLVAEQHTNLTLLYYKSTGVGCHCHLQYYKGDNNNTKSIQLLCIIYYCLVQSKLSVNLISASRIE